METTLQVGVGKKCITPPLGTPLYGYPYHRPAESVGDDLHVTAAAFSYGETKAILFSADIVSCSADFTDKIKAEVALRTGFPTSCMIYSVTHTHSGPQTTLKSSGWGKTPDHSYLDEILLPCSIQAAVEAVNNLKPALFGVGVTQSDVAANRRELTPNGSVELGQNPWGLVDKEMTVLSFKDRQTDSVLLNIVHYGCHGTASGHNLEITRDWPGTMKDTLERELGGTAMFLPGAIGECGPRCPNGKTTQNYTVAQELGCRAGYDAIQAWKSIKLWQSGPLVAVCDTISVPYDPLPAKELALTEVEKLGTEEELWANGKRREINELYRWQDILAEYDKEALETHYKSAQCILAFGPVALVPFAFEMFLHPTLQLRRYSKFPHTLSLSNTNDTKGYLPSQDQLCRGGYEVWSFRYLNTYKLVDNADDYMVTENLKLLDHAFEKMQNI